MIVRRGDETRDLTGILLDEFLELIGSVPVDVEVVGEVFLGDAGVAELLHPGSDAVIVAADEDDLLAVGVSTRDHDRERRHITAVLAEECPVRHIDGVDHLFRHLDHGLRDEGGAVALLELLDRRRVDVGIVVAEEVGAVGAHIVDVAVAVEVPDVGALRAGHEERISADGDHAALGGTEVTVDARGDEAERLLEERLTLGNVVYLFGFVLQFHNLIPPY